MPTSVQIHLFWGEFSEPLPPGAAAAVALFLKAEAPPPPLSSGAGFLPGVSVPPPPTGSPIAPAETEAQLRQAYATHMASVPSPPPAGGPPAVVTLSGSPPAWLCKKALLFGLAGSVFAREFAATFPSCPGETTVAAEIALFIVVTPGQTAEPNLVRIPAGGAGDASVSIAATALSPIAREILAKRAWIRPIMEQIAAEWGTPSPQRDAFVLDQAHFFIRNSEVKNSELARHWMDEYSMMFFDFGIPARDWDAIVVNYPILRRIFEDEIPWFKLGEKDYPRRCARGMPFVAGRDGTSLSYVNPRLYAPTFSSYFPREDAQIHADLAAYFGANLPSLIGCVEHKLTKRVREVERSVKFAMVMKAIVPSLIFPSAPVMAASAAGLAAEAFAPEYASWARTIAASLVTIALGGGGVAGGAIQGIVKKIATEAFDRSREFMSKAIESIGTESARSLVEMATGIGDLEGQMAPFALWLLVAPGVAPIVTLAGQWLGVRVDIRKDVIDPLVEKAKASGLPLPDFLKSMVAENEAEVAEISPIGSGEGAPPLTTESDDLLVAGAAAAGGLFLAWAAGIV